MGIDIETFIESTQNLATAALLERQFLAAVNDEGYENVVFARTNNQRLVSLPLARFPVGYVDAYTARQWDKIDPVVARAQSARAPFRWSDARPRGGFTKEQDAFFEECRELGVHSGITIPIGASGQHVDLISLSLRQKGQVPAHRLTHAYLLSVQYWLKYCELTDRRREVVVGLTGQEVECLKWCKEGKTNWEIGEILRISEKTVEFHLSNGMRKLGANNRITAVIMGIRMGLVPL
ncbi:helix-turn-helix transcriptional regulator [Bradyrhizobium vignae]|uniref:Putative Transcriptional regulator, LuxR family n=1 Tax=Bradyrhizobium vignae TaxID=1549949 RepID=A0A2U3PUP5_9BRAD|nr:LuxR C-terminal-related transcriptional regulator [Bradyrhizobium vignae]SPP92875.1 putative Transcriptional regulator, LuxR family [Bradyrhizobium vignae]